MKVNGILVTILLFAIAIFLIFNYIPVIIDLSALENERQILLQVLKKNNEVEQRLFQEKTRPPEAKKRIPKKSQEIKPPVQTEKKTKGNRGYLIKDGKPL